MKLNVNKVKFYGPSGKIGWGQNIKVNEYWLEGNVKVKLAKDKSGDNFWQVRSNGTVRHFDKKSSSYKGLVYSFNNGCWVETKNFKKNIG